MFCEVTQVSGGRCKALGVPGHAVGRMGRVSSRPKVKGPLIVHPLFGFILFELASLPMCHPFASTLVACLPLPVRQDAMGQVAGRGRKRHLSLQGTVPDQATSAQAWCSALPYENRETNMT